MQKVRAAVQTQMPELTTYFQSSGLVDAVLNLGLLAPIDIQVTGSDLKQTYATAEAIRERVKSIPGVSDAFIPQDIDAPALHLSIDRYHADELGLSQKEVVSNVGLLPMALKLGTGTEAYAPLARAIIGGLLVSVALTVFIVPSAVLIIYRENSQGAVHLPVQSRYEPLI